MGKTIYTFSKKKNQVFGKIIGFAIDIDFEDVVYSFSAHKNGTISKRKKFSFLII
jgi:hypothetical protein